MFERLLRRKNIEAIEKFKARIDSEGIFDEPQFTTIVETKYKEKVLIYYPKKFEDYVQIRMYISNNADRNIINLIFKDANMDIADIQVLGKENISRGYGSLLMEQSLFIAKSKGIKTVTGIIFSEDEANRMRQNNFYSKYGFNIDGNKIRLEL